MGQLLAIYYSDTKCMGIKYLTFIQEPNEGQYNQQIDNVTNNAPSLIKHLAGN